MDWFNVPQETVKELLFDDFQHVPVIKIGGYFPQEATEPWPKIIPIPFRKAPKIRFHIELRVGYKSACLTPRDDQWAL